MPSSIPSGSQSVGQDQRGTIGDHTSCTVVVKRVWPLDIFKDLLDLSLELPRALPLLEKLLLQPKSNIYYRNPQMLQLHTWRLDLPDSQRTWLRGLPEVNFEEKKKSYI